MTLREVLWGLLCASVVSASSPFYAAMGSPLAAVATVRAARTESNNVTVPVDVKDVCSHALGGHRWHAYYGEPQQTLADALECFAGETECMRHVETLVREHIDGGGEHLVRLIDNLGTVVELTEELEGQAGVCEVSGEAVVPFIRMRQHVAHHTSNRRGRYRQRMRQLERERRQREAQAAAAAVEQEL